MVQMQADMIPMEAGNTKILIDLNAGARLASLNIDGLEVLVPKNDDILRWGSYPMAPWCGRVRDGRFDYEGQTYELPRTMPPHAIHGTTFYRPWRQIGMGHFERDLSEEWPWAGRAVQKIDLSENQLNLRLEVISDALPFPASAGYHPWFNRQLSIGGALKCHFQAESMYQRDAFDLPNGKLVKPPIGPWDDSFKNVQQPIVLEWPDALKLHLRSNTDHWVVYSEPTHALCVEPTTAPPDALNIAQHIVRPDVPLILETTWTWER